MTTDFCALCAELIDALDECQRPYGDQPESFLVWKARAALAEQPVGEGPPAVTTGAWLHPAYEPGDGSADGAQMVELAWWHPQFGCDSLQMVVDNARAILARWGNPAPQPPAEGEVAELVAWLRGTRAARLTRAADLLQRQYPQPVAVAPYREVADLVVWLEDHSAECLELDQPEWSQSIAQAARFLHLYLKATPQPVAISERLPGPEDCDVEGRCWWGEPQIEDSHDATWNLCTQDDAEEFCTWGTKCGWLPFHALPLPELEVKK